MALLSQPLTKLYYTAGRDEVVVVKAENTTEEHVIKIKSAAKEFEIIPEVRSVGTQISVFTGTQIKDAGLYNLNSNGDRITQIAFNYDRAESTLEVYPEKDIKNQILDGGLTNFSVLNASKNKSLMTVISEINSGKQLWKLMLIAALAFLLAEIVLLRFWK
jgi:hypothetical protein